MTRVRSEAGVTLIELIVAMVIGMGTLLAVFAILDTSVRYGVSDRMNWLTPRSRYFCSAADTSAAEPTSHVVPAPSPPYLLGVV